MHYHVTVKVTMKDDNTYVVNCKINTVTANSPMEAIQFVYSSIMENYGLLIEQIASIESDAKVVYTRN